MTKDAILVALRRPRSAGEAHADAYVMAHAADEIERLRDGLGYVATTAWSLPDARLVAHSVLSGAAVEHGTVHITATVCSKCGGIFHTHAECKAEGIT